VPGLNKNLKQELEIIKVSKSIQSLIGSMVHLGDFLNPGVNLMSFLTNKRALIVGLASNRSIAAGIAEAMHREGAELAFTYQNERLQPRVEKMAAEYGSSICLPLDASSDEQIENCFSQLKNSWDHFDILVHSIAYAPAEQLEGNFVDVVTREGFRIAHDISSYTLAALAKASLPFMEGRQGAIVTLSYLGAEKAVPNYNVMGLAKASLEANVRYLAAGLGPRGIRVNGISAGPIKTLAASGINHFKEMLHYHEASAPTRRNIEPIEVGNVAAFLCSDLAMGVTGEITYVDGGFNIVAMNNL
jgi:enoyl-[acyl-carrier protein] reductase I